MDVRNNFGKDAVFVSRQYVKPFLQERLAIRRVLLQDQEALAKAKAGRLVEIIEIFFPVGTSFDLSESSHSFLQVEIDLLSSLCDHPHIVHFQGAQIFSRGGSERVFCMIFA